MFAVRTPTAVVTDLGTEFGVEVDVNGDTTSHVFQGTVVVKAGIRGFGNSEIEDLGIRNSGVGVSDKRPATAVAGEDAHETVTLVAGKSVRVGRVRETHQESAAGELVRFTHPTTRPQFARRISQPPKLLDLLDIIAGGNGSGRQRERGLDPTTGMEDPIFVLGKRIGDGKYHPVQWHKLIDGLFIPGKGPVQIDSVGGAFHGFRATSGSTWGSIWSRASEIDPAYKRRGWIYEIERCEQFMPERLGMIGVCPNVGLTFDLAAVREMYKSVRPDRLRTVAGLGNRVDFADPFDGKIDLWVIVDGEARFNRLGMKRKDGAIEIDVKLKTTDRFLTLAVTDGGDGQAGDWVIFGDPVIQTKQIEENP